MAAFLSPVISGTTNAHERATFTPGTRILASNERLRASIEKSKKSYLTEGGEISHLWKPDRQRLERVLVKNARGHALFEFSEPMLEAPDEIRWIALETMSSTEKDAFESVEPREILPEVGSRGLYRLLSGYDLVDNWVMVQEGNYRYAVIQRGGIAVRSVIWEYLATEVWWRES